MTEIPEPEAARDQAVRWLARREYSVHELRQRLVARGFSDGVVDQVLADLRAENLVCDRRFAESLVRSRVERGYGPLKIAHELRSRGVDEALVDELLEEDDLECWVERLRTVWEKRFGAAPETYREWASQARRLQSRGFTAEQIRRVIPDIDG